jgi:hypothetical protein
LRLRCLGLAPPAAAGKRLGDSAIEPGLSGVLDKAAAHAKAKG